MTGAILVTGGLGYIGSHTCVAIAASGFQPVILDNCIASRPSTLGRLTQILGAAPTFVRGDIRDRSLLEKILADHKVEAVMHFAGLKAVAESVDHPLEYFDVNVHGTLTLLQAMQQAGVKRFVFSSSAAVYGEPEVVPIDEGSACKPTSPYGRSKLIVEDMLADLFQSEPGWSVARLRYFNPAGAHPSGLIGEDPAGNPNNLFPRLARAASGALTHIDVYGSDYATVDGTGLRDYVHVMDLAEGHIAALSACLNERGLLTLNLGSGRGYTVMQAVRAFEAASGKAIDVKVCPRRSGDVSHCWADISKAKKTLGWQPARDLSTMCRDAWRWQSTQD